MRSRVHLPGPDERRVATVTKGEAPRSTQLALPQLTPPHHPPAPYP
jgi:hypothetical protein